MIENVTRRKFMQITLSSAAFVLAVRTMPSPLFAESGVIGDDAVSASAFHPSIFLGLDPDGTVHIVAHRSEMGSGSRTALPLIVADEMDADWKRVRIEQAIGDERYGGQDTDGSHSVRDFFEPMREIGGTARLMLIQAAAQQWNVPASECTTELHSVVHRGSGRKIGYGELAVAAAKLPVPKADELELKSPSDWRYIGKFEKGNYDFWDISQGKAQFGMDVRVPGMLYASIEHPPVLGGKVKSFDNKEALKVPGVRQTATIEPFKPPCVFQPLGGVAVIGDNTWATFSGRKKLKVEWESSPHASYNSAAYKEELKQTCHKPGKVFRNIGDVDAVFAKADKIVEADYYAPHLAHVSMEPPVAVADYRDGKVTVWCPTQNPQAVQETIGGVLGIPKENVICHVTLLGGGFGRKSKPDYAAEAAVLSKQTGRPVKVVWTREDDIKFDYFHSVAAMYMKAAVDTKGMPTALLQRSTFPPIASTFAVGANHGEADDVAMGFSGVPFAIPNIRVENGAADAHVRIGWLRSVCNIYHAFAVHSFADELAHNAGQDPVQYLHKLYGRDRILGPDELGADYPEKGDDYKKYPIDTARYRRVLDVAAEKSGWGKQKLPKGSGMGVAVHRSFLSYVATVVRADITDKGEVKIRRVDTAVDAGLVVNPDNVRSQMEGAAVFGTSLAMLSEITAENGVIKQSNFDDYQVARMGDAPYEINVYIVGTDNPPAGVGEPGVPPFAPALCNAIFAATGKRVRELPISKTKLV